MHEWEPMEEDEEENSDYEYETRSDGVKYCRKKAENQEAEGVKDIFLTARDPFYFKEVPIYY
jgi:hypothetical protein